MNLLAESPVFSIWRAPTDNDMNIKHKWMEQGFHRVNSHIYNTQIIKQTEKEVVVQTELSLGGYTVKNVAHLICIWTIYGNGEIVVNTEVKVREGMPFLPRFGMQFTMPEGNENVEYFGYGPHESYIDKRRSTRNGKYVSTVDTMFENYLKPQENGSHYKTDWALVTNAQGIGLLFVGMDDFSFNAAHYTPQEITAASHPYKLKRRKETIINIDYAMSGVGSNSCGPELLPHYGLSETEFKFTFRVMPVLKDDISLIERIRTEII
jgi:beta-galactosidase